MSQQPSHCPDTARLRGFRDGSLLDADQHAVAAHIESCAWCRAQLERWAQDPAASACQRADLTTAGRSETWDRPACRSEGATEPDGEPGAGDVAIDFLAPSDRPGSLGRLGPYEVLDRIGQGGMGIVLKAHETRLNRVVAVKVLMPALAGSDLARRRFTREAQAAAAVCHEHVDTIHAVDEAAGLPYLVMQLVAGQSLQQKLKREGPLGLKETLRIGMQIASGLAAAHAQGLVHRDIKPGNIMLENGVARVKITDFGLARPVDDVSLSVSGTIAGTPYYMSPEQACGEPIDRRADLFSLGSVLYAMCTGQPPFKADSTVAVLRQVSDEPPRPIRDLNPDVPEWLAAIIAKLMAKDPAGRYQTAADVADVLARRLAELEQPPQPASTVTAAGAAPGRRAPRMLEVVAVLLSLAALAIGLLTWWVVRMREKAHDASQPVAGPPAGPSHPDPPPAPAPLPVPRAALENEARDRAVASALMSQAAEAARKHDLPRAADLYTEAIERDPANTAARLGRASTYISETLVNWTGAIADATEVIQLDPENAAAYEIRAHARQRSGAFQSAIDDATEAIRLDPKRVWAYLYRAAAYNGLSEWKDAIVDLDELIRRAPEARWAWYWRAVSYAGLGANDRALGDVEHAIILEPSVGQFWLLRGRIRGQLKDYERAMADYAEAIRLADETSKPWAYGGRANLERSHSKIEPAIADYTEAIRLRGDKVKPEEAGLYSARASVYLAHGENDRALADLDQAIRLNPRIAWVYHTRGIARVRTGQWDRAIDDFEEGRKAAGSDKLWAGACLVGCGEALAISNRIDEAEAAFEKSLSFAPSRLGHVLTARAWFIDRLRGDYDAALEKLEEPAKTGMILAFLYRGLIYARTGMPEKALADLAAVIKRVEPRPDWFALSDYVPHWLALLLGRGEAYLQKGDLDRALADSEDAVKFAPNSAEARLLRARVHAQRGEDELAAADRRQAQRLAPDQMLVLPEPKNKPGT